MLTKVDIAGPARAEAWTRHLAARFPAKRIVHVEAYGAKAQSALHQGRARFEPRLPQTFRARLVEAIKELHAEIVTPPEAIRGDPEKVAKWRAPSKREIDWERVASAGGGHAVAPKPGDLDPTDPENDVEPEFLTIGLIGE